MKVLFKVEMKDETKHPGTCWWRPPRDSVAAEYCLDSSMHGLKYLGQAKRHLVERIFWVLAFLTAVCIAAYFISRVWEQYKASPVIVSFQPMETAIDQIPFPAITICNVNNVQREIAQAYISLAQKLLTNGEPEYNEENSKAILHLYYLNHICSTNSFSRNFGFNSDLIDDRLMNDTLKYVDKHNTTGKRGGTEEFLEQVAQNCENMILLCYWGDEPKNCTELFTPTLTENGICCTFNMVPASILLRLRNDSRDSEKEVNKWLDHDLDPDTMILSVDEVKRNGRDDLPRRQLRSGRSSGLSVLLNPDLKNYFCTNADSVGFQLDAHFPLGYPQIAENGIAIPPSSEVFMNIRPIITTSDDNISEFPLRKRQCYFGGEYELHFYEYYTLSNCIGECISNFTFRRCGCVRYYQPSNFFDLYQDSTLLNTPVLSLDTIKTEQRGVQHSCSVLKEIFSSYFQWDDIRRLCGPYSFNCTEEARKHIIQTGMRKNCNKCLPPCTEVVYNKETTVIPLRKDIDLWKINGANYSWPTNVTEDELTILHIFFSDDSTYGRIRTRLFDETELLSNTGGILGLCLGFSGLSLLEILYFLTLRAWCRSIRGRRINATIASAAVKMWKSISRTNSSTTVENIDFYKENKTFATPEDFQTWALSGSKTSQPLTLEINPSYKPQYWAPP